MDSAVESLFKLLVALPDDVVDLLIEIEREETMSMKLKFRIMSLAAEAAIIRRQERKLAKSLARRHIAKGTDAMWSSIQSHRRVEVRWETRKAHLAMAFIKGRPYADAEPFYWDAPILSQVEALAEGFSPDLDERAFEQRWEQWLQEARVHMSSVQKAQRKKAKATHEKRVARKVARATGKTVAEVYSTVKLDD